MMLFLWSCDLVQICVKPGSKGKPDAFFPIELSCCFVLVLSLACVV